MTKMQKLREQLRLCENFKRSSQKKKKYVKYKFLMAKSWK